VNPGAETAFDGWMRRRVYEPLLKYVPYWVTPNAISVSNTLVCWTAFMIGYWTYKFEHIYPLACCWLRILMGVMIFSSIILDCLDGMHARATGRCSKLGELLDHSLDAANVPLICCCVLTLLWPDRWTILLSLIGGSMVYNAQLVIYRHTHVMVLPPVTGPTAQALVSASLAGSGIFFLYFSRHSYFVQLCIFLFIMLGNITQAQQNWFYVRHLLPSKDHSSILAPHLRFSAIMILHGSLLVAGWITDAEYMLSGTLLAYRLNGRYVLDTLRSFKTYASVSASASSGSNGESKKDAAAEMMKEDKEWRTECVIAIILLIILAATTGTQGQVIYILGLPLITVSLFHAAFYISVVLAVASNARDILNAMPFLLAK